jgi:2-polyprenyl-3-methyl-5-hydroxy-6-metoxy-1,4-benzoquinol methylase
MAGQWKADYAEKQIEQVNCPHCSAASHSQLAEERSLGIVQCSVCRLVYVNPRIKDPEKNYWGEKEGTLHKYGAILDGLEPHERDKNYQEHLDTVRALKPTGRLLDIGTHCGFFLRMARNQSWELHGIEPSPANAALAKEKFGLDVHVGYLEDDVFPPEFFDIVTLVDVLEHVTTPLPLLSTIRKILKPGGILFVKVPNVRWNLLKYQILVKALKLKNFDVFDSREHVVHYSQETLAKMLEKAGLVVKVFYVPHPIQTGESWKKIGRAGAWSLAKLGFLCTGTLGPLSTDLACVAEKSK